MKGAQVSVAPYTPTGWPPDTACVGYGYLFIATNIDVSTAGQSRSA
jgi:hypothetical protein